MKIKKGVFQNLYKWNYLHCKKYGTAPNRSVYASPPVGARTTKNRSRTTDLCAVFLRPKCHIQPERYASFALTFIENHIKHF
jgi:hypothetical protein